MEAPIDSRDTTRHPDAAACRAHRLLAEGAMPTYAKLTVAAPMPNLENLRKQAKLILRWHRDRHYPVAAQIRSGLPRFSQMTDPEILSSSFRLGDAQELVARRHGFESWQALKTGLPTMPEHADTTSTVAFITAAEPQLFVADINASCDFFTGKLGFTVAFTYGEPPFYAQVMRDRARINLRCVAGQVIDPERRDREELLAASFTVASVEEIKQLFLAFQSAGAMFFQTLRREPWGAKDFIVRDPDGNLLLFAGPSE
jgi:catechol 2,3-dioxygenase-like lactoylglutathione lyase family enzyme